MAFQASMRMTGLNTGFDTDAMVQSMMSAENMRLSKMQKSMMLDTYRQEQYQSIYNDLKTFQKDFLDVMKAGTLRSENTFSSLMSVLGGDGKSSSAVSIGANSKKGNYTIDVKQLAAADLYESKSKIGGSIRSAEGFQFDIADVRPGAKYKFTLDGSTRTVSFNIGDKVKDGIAGLTGGQLTTLDGQLAVRGTESVTLDNGEVRDYTVVKALSEEDFAEIFSDKLEAAFGPDGETGKSKIEAKITADGGISFNTNGFHTGFSISNASYNFASSSSSQPVNLTGKEQLNFRVMAGQDSLDIVVDTKGKASSDIISEINKQLVEGGFSDKLSVEMAGGKIKFTNYSTKDRLMIGDNYAGMGSMAAMGFTEAVSLGAGGGLTDLGITSGASAKMNVNDTIGKVFGDSLTAERSFIINGTRFTFNEGTRIADLIEGVNSKNLGVKMSYDSNTETFKLESDKTGYANRIEMSGAFLTGNLGFGTEAKVKAADSIAVIDGTTLTRAENSYNYEGVDWTLNAKTDGELKVSSASDVDKVMESIKGFIDGYNALVQKLRDQTGTMRPKSKGAYFDPLTDEERADMKENDIKLWDENAKKGLLFNDSILEGIETQLRAALNQSVTLEDGSKLSLASLGITTSRDWTKGGQLEIQDEAKLRDAIVANGDKIGELFTKATEEGGKGLAERVNDVLTNALSATGPIAKKAGIKGNYTETDNEIFRRLKTQNDAIEKMMETLAQKEENYYIKFSKIEAAMSQANSQMQYVQSMFGGGA